MVKDLRGRVKEWLSSHSVLIKLHAPDFPSTTVKAVALNGRVTASAIKPTGANPRKTGEVVLEELLANRILDSEETLVF